MYWIVGHFNLREVWRSGPIRLRRDAIAALEYVKEKGTPLVQYSISKWKMKKEGRMHRLK
jgi:hypothetical protein